MPFARVRDLKMYYEIQGSGPRLLFVGGSGGDLRRKPNVFDGPLAKRFSQGRLQRVTDGVAFVDHDNVSFFKLLAIDVDNFFRERPSLGQA